MEETAIVRTLRRAFHCDDCGWEGNFRQLSWSRQKGSTCPKCNSSRISRDVAPSEVLHDVPSYGQMIRDAIAQHEMTHRDVAEQIGLSPVELSHIVNERRPLKFDVALKLEQLLGIPAEALLSAQLQKHLHAERLEFVRGH